MRMLSSTLVCVALHEPHHHIHTSIKHVPLVVWRHIMCVQRQNRSATSHPQRHLPWAHERFTHPPHAFLQYIMRTLTFTCIPWQISYSAPLALPYMHPYCHMHIITSSFNSRQYLQHHTVIMFHLVICVPSPNTHALAIYNIGMCSASWAPSSHPHFHHACFTSSVAPHHVCTTPKS